MSARKVSDLDLEPLRKQRFHPSPAAWEDQVLYFLLVDRFSDGKEQGFTGNDGQPVSGGATAPFQPADAKNAIQSEADARRWRDAGGRFVGGTLEGARTKIGYLKRLGATAIWISPVLKQVSFEETYHGYGVQDFLEIDPHFGTADDLRRLVATAHEHGLYVILDIILNHTGNVFGYDPDRYWTEDGQTHQRFLDPRWDGRPYRVAGFRARDGSASIPFGPVDASANPAAWPDGAVWPAELQAPTLFTQKGRISNWDNDPEFLEADFFDLKDITLGRGPIDDYQPSAALLALARAYQYWIAWADLDGFRVDTVKHMDPGATRYFTSAIHEFAQSIRKDNFYLIGEITGGRTRAYETLEATGIDAALGIDEIPDKLEWMVKGSLGPEPYFDLFRNSVLVRKESHAWFRNKVVTVLDDHDQVRKGEQKARFCADAKGKQLALAALGLNATTLGIPCIYYGSEQRFDGHGGNDRYIREAMFGGEFGPFESRSRHAFDESGPLYTELSRILAHRARLLPLRRGRQYLREISGDGATFGPPRPIEGEMRSIVAWSRILDRREILLAINTDTARATTAWVTLDAELQAQRPGLECLYSTDAAEIGRSLLVQPRNGRAVQLTVPAAGFVVYE